MKTQRPLPVTIAVTLQALLGLAAIFITVSELIGNVSPDEAPPMFIIIASLVVGTLSLISAWGAWQGKRWGQILTIVLRAYDGLTSALGIFVAGSVALVVTAVVSVILAIVVIWLLLMPVSRQWYSTAKEGNTK